MAMYRKLSNKVQLPVGTEWGIPYTSSVAECMVWPSASVKVPDPYHDSLGRTRRAIPESKVGILQKSYEKRCPDIHFQRDVSEYATMRMDGELKIKAPTPFKVTETQNYADRFSSYYVENSPERQTYDLGRQHYYDRQGHLDTDRSIKTHIRAKSVGPCESYRDTERYASQANEDADLIASFLDARDAETYERAKRDIYEHTYQKQLEEERKRLYLERQKEYEEHVRAHTGRAILDETALQEALRRQARSSASASFANRMVGGRPPLPRPPAGMKSEHRSEFTDPRTRTRKVVGGPGMVDNFRVVTGNTEGALQNLHRAALSRALLETPEFEEQPKPVKRVNFRSRPTSASDTQRSRRGGHFFVWRNASEDPMLRDDLWRMQKYQNVKSRIDNRWTSDPFAYKKKDDGKVDLKLECPQGEEMNVSLRVEATPSRTGFIC